MADFIPDAQFTPDAASPAAGFVPDSQFKPDDSNMGQAVQAGVEGALGPLAGPGVGLPGTQGLMKTGLGIGSEEGIRSRAEAHPIAHAAGELTNLAIGPEGVGLEALGKGAVEAVGLAQPATYAAKVGSSIVKNAAEMAAFQSQDEVGKAILHDPSTGAESAISNIGLATALGGVGGGLITGVASPLWSATKGAKINDGLKAMVGRWGGIEGEQAASKATQLGEQAGVEIPNEIKAVLDDQPGAREAHSILSQDDARIAGRSYQKKLQELDNQLGVRTAESLGKTTEDIANVPERNNYETGQNLGETLHNELKPTVDDISNRYDKITDQFKSKQVLPDSMRTMGDQLSQKAIDEGWHKAYDDANMKLVNKVLEGLPKQETIDDLKKSISSFYRPFDAPDFRAAQEIKKVLNKGLESSVAAHMGPEELAGYTKLRQDYAQLSSHLEDLDTHLHLGKWAGPKTFLDALKEKANSKGEALLSNMTGKNNAGLLDLLQNHPETLSAISDHYKDSLIRAAAKSTNPGELLKTSKLLRDINEMSPQQKALIATPEQHARIEAVNEIKQGLIDPNHNFSNTARTMQKHMSGAVSPLSVIAMMLGHGDAGLLSYLGPMGLAEARSGMKLAMLKFLGSAKPVNAEGFAAAAEYFHAAQKGANVLSKAAENVFKPGTQVLIASQMPTAVEIAKLDKLVASNDPKNTSRIMASAENGHVGHYLPEHQTALTSSSLASLQYLKALRPQPTQLNPLDAPIDPTPAQEARYHRALEIAQQPAVVLQRVKDGSVQVSDLQDLKGMYPAVFNQLSQKLSTEMMNQHAKHGPIPYKTRMGISLFLGQPMDSTMQPTSIISAQPQPKPQAPSPPNGGNKKGTSNLGKSNKQYRTPSQTAEEDRGNRD